MIAPRPFKGFSVESKIRVMNLKTESKYKFIIQKERGAKEEDIAKVLFAVRSGSMLLLYRTCRF